MVCTQVGRLIILYMVMFPQKMTKCNIFRRDFPTDTIKRQEKTGAFFRARRAISGRKIGKLRFFLLDEGEKTCYKYSNEGVASTETRSKSTSLTERSGLL
jgi:hypothetical protein